MCRPKVWPELGVELCEPGGFQLAIQCIQSKLPGCWRALACGQDCSCVGVHDSRRDGKRCSRPNGASVQLRVGQLQVYYLKQTVPTAPKEIALNSWVGHLGCHCGQVRSHIMQHLHLR